LHAANLAKNGAKIFELNELPDNSTQKWSLQPSRPTWLGKWNDFGKADWLDILEFPETTFKSTQQLLAVA